jgi:predicted Ser/Thr protein kinase
LRLSRRRAFDLTVRGSPTIEPELEAWLLEHLEHEGRIVGHGYQAVVRRLDSAAGELVVKSPHPNRVLAWFGRRAIRREAEVYDRLQGLAGVPRSFGLAGSEHLVLEHVSGSTLKQLSSALDDRDRFFARLIETIEAMHTRGVAHGDLKRKENTIVGPGETPCVIDFGVACLREPDSRGMNRMRFELTRQMDLNAYIKMKYGPRPEAMTPEDAALHKPLLIERIARRARKPWQLMTLRPMRKRRRERRGSGGE